MHGSCKIRSGGFSRSNFLGKGSEEVFFLGADYRYADF